MIDFRPALSIVYRNFFLNQKVILLSFILIGWGFLQIIAFKIPISYLYMLLVPIVGLQQQVFYTHSMVEDRYTNFKIVYKIMGLKRSQYLAGQATSFALLGVFMLGSIFLAGIACNLFRHVAPLWSALDWSVLLLSFFYFLNLTFFATTISFCFSNPQIAKEFSVIFYYILLYYNAYAVFVNENVVFQWLSPHSFYARYCMGVALGERLSPLPDILKMVAQTLLYATLTLYLDNVVGTDEHTKPPLFFLNAFRRRNVEAEPLPTDQEMEAEDERNCLNVTGLSKRFGSFSALSGVNVKLEKGKIHCLLGHNGAGKSTFVNLLIGYYKSTEGKILYNGLDLGELHKSESDAIRIGICPSSDILFGELTVFQHLRMMCMIKKIRNVGMVVEKALGDFNLGIFRKHKVSELSGGNKRKLMIAMSLIGDPTIVFFDEPTSALDPVSRKDIWNILLKLKENSSQKIILLTTHHLEEAERLADNVIFLAGGNVRMTGSIEHLKKNFGLGLTIEVFRNETTSHDRLRGLADELREQFYFLEDRSDNLVLSERKLEIRIPLESSKDAPQILELIKNALPDAPSVSINTNTLEKAYIEIDRNFHEELNEGMDELLSKALKNLYTSAPPLGFRGQVYLVAKNKLQFLVNDLLELIKLVSQYLIVAVSMASVLLYLRRQQVAFVSQTNSVLFTAFVYLELFMSSFSIHNLVYESSKDIKSMMFINKIRPSAYYTGKLLADFVPNFFGYAVIFVTSRVLLERELAFEVFRTAFYLNWFKVAMWKAAFLAGGCLFHRLFDSPRSALNLYSMFYMGLDVAAFLLSRYIWKGAVIFNDFSAISSILNDQEVGYMATTYIFGLIFCVYFVLAVILDNQSLRFNYTDGRLDSKLPPTVAESGVDMGASPLNFIQRDLKKSVEAEEKAALSAHLPGLTALGLRKNYKKARPVLDNVTFQIKENSNFGLIGPNGAGKSTIFNILLSKIRKSAGTIRLTSPLPPSASLLSENSPFTHHNFSVCFQGDSVWEHLSVARNIRFYAELHRVNMKALGELLHFFEFENYLTKNASELSAGNKRKLCIINSLLINPNLVFFDEATCGIDINMRLRMKGIIEHFKTHNHSIGLFTTHFLKDIEVFCDKIGIISSGDFLCIDYIDEIKRKLGGYISVVHLIDWKAKDQLLSRLGSLADVKVVAVDPEEGQVKLVMTNLRCVFGIFTILAEEKGHSVGDFSFNQLSIEDIYLDIFDRSE